jgi:peptidoglycan/xylan/chitin deacetylase (PgdA/CDA1 family)
MLIVSHDIDWPLNGPGAKHVMARRDRFPQEILDRVAKEGFNPYNGIRKVVEIEEQQGIKSTFLFRPKYDNGCDVGEYASTLRMLQQGGFEVGLHANDTSTLEQVKLEKSMVEQAAGANINGCRIHYLRVVDSTFSNLAAAGFRYDSSLMFDKKNVDPRDTGYLVRDGIVVFPITFMDAFLFSYTKLTEENVVPYVVKNVEELYARGARILTLLWHDNSVLMRGGRAYGELIKQLAAKGNITFLKGIEAYQLVKKQVGM